MGRGSDNVPKPSMELFVRLSRNAVRPLTSPVCLSFVPVTLDSSLHVLGCTRTNNLGRASSRSLTASFLSMSLGCHDESAEAGTVVPY
jgi:hypothetical protein